MAKVVDVKSASGFSFKKFQHGTLRDSDPFGYMYQLAGYEKAEGTDNGGFLAINKGVWRDCFVPARRIR